MKSRGQRKRIIAITAFACSSLLGLGPAEGNVSTDADQCQAWSEFEINEQRDLSGVDTWQKNISYAASGTPQFWLDQTSYGCGESISVHAAYN